jgi:dipeptidyl-peptidase-4
MIRKSFTLICSLLFFFYTQGQQKTLTIDDAVLKGRTTLAPERMLQLQWLTDGKRFSYIGTDTGKKELLIIGTVEKTKYDTVLKVSELYESLKRINAEAKEISRFPAITWISTNAFRYSIDSAYYVFNLLGKTTTKSHELSAKAENMDMNEATGFIAYTEESNLYIQPPFIGQRPKRLDVGISEKDGIVYGQAVHRNEFGILKGTFWSPRGTMLAFYRMDESMVTTYPIVGLDSQPSQAKNIRYPMAGAASHHVTVGVYSALKNKTIYLNTGEPQEQYLTNIAWSPDENYIYIAVVNRGQNHLWLKQFDALTGMYIKTLFEETSEKYIEPEKAMIFVKNNPNQFIWHSERDGYTHLYLYQTDGTLVKQLTKGNWVVTDFAGFDEKGKNIYFTSTKESAVERHIYKLPIAGGDPIKLDSGAGTHTAIFNSTCSHFIEYWSSTSIPRNIGIIDGNGKKKNKLLAAKNPLAEYIMPTVNIFTIKAADGVTDLFCREIKPAGFDPSKKYPVMVYVYNGPHVQLINNTWLASADLWFYAFAQQGYIVFTVDGRGSLNRGRDFEQAVHRKLGTEEAADQLKGIDWLKMQPYIDASRLAIHGWSFGGFMTTTMMCKYPDLFKTGVCGGPVIDWGMYEVMYTERYMDTPEENPEGYKNSNLLNVAGQLKNKLLMIHGTSDNVVLWEHSLKFVKQCVNAGNTNLDYFVYPEHLHNVSGRDRLHLVKKITDYIKINLQ